VQWMQKHKKTLQEGIYNGISRASIQQDLKTCSQKNRRGGD
jgi:hypothetical protein